MELLACQVCHQGKISCRCYSCPQFQQFQSQSPLHICLDCDAKIHKDSKHQRGMLCSECESEEAHGYCADCE